MVTILHPLYRTKLFTIPTPEFYVLHNGVDACPDENTLRLSDAFSRLNIPGIESLPSLEPIIRVLNVNVGHNEKIFEKCDVLRGYAVAGDDSYQVGLFHIAKTNLPIFCGTALFISSNFTRSPYRDFSMSSSSSCVSPCVQ